jgi:uncharacterized membrane protein YphA (DoxX/SURF4 family)
MKRAIEIVTDLARYAVGILFIFSGIVKANDPIGFSYKLEEYFIEFPEFGPLHALAPMFEFLHDWALPQAIFIVILEVILGVAILVRWRTKLTTILLLGLILFFTILTFASAYFGIVKTCGCFGDVILSVLIIILFIRRKKISLRETNVHDYVLTGVGLFVLGKLCYSLGWWFPFNFTLVTFAIFYVVRLFDHIRAGFYTTTLATLGMIWFSFYCYSYLPMKDFRAYAVGKSISEGMIEVPDELKYIYKLKNKETGVEEEFDAFPENYQETYEYLDFRTEVIKKGIEPKVLDFEIRDEFGSDLTEEILQDSGFTFLMVSYNLETATTQVLPRFNELAADVQKAGHRFVCLNASYPETVEVFRQEQFANYPFLYVDQTVLKTIIRSNPGLLLIQNGAVLDKWHHNDSPAFDDLDRAYLSGEAIE